ncbi:MerR-like helix-turn-helix DNA binding domain protein [Arthrobacter phage Whytu]|uniref:MerR-like helix-turn-helix DNA binding domain protein n=1 Tax=Arthrobacter phage Whytu TaxID=2713260 RepID=A0A6G8R2P9_9CAUD|nr:MerR-like helix-turn-helix DNA binding domain protein [Arthrobacter phage Whytu]QIN94485.1 MerR-like helix-turn-helix DNA binding domain protein [Arthrobacter phage Whytu]
MEQAANRVGVSVRTVERYVDAGKLDAHKLPSGRRRVRVGDVDGLLRPVRRPAGGAAKVGSK